MEESEKIESNSNSDNDFDVESDEDLARSVAAQRAKVKVGDFVSPKT